MRRLTRRLFTLCSAASLALCVGAGVLAVVSRRHFIQASYHWPRTTMGWWSSDGRVHLAIQSRTSDRTGGLGLTVTRVPPDEVDRASSSQRDYLRNHSARSFAGVTIVVSDWPRGSLRVVAVPYAFIAAAAAALPFVWLGRFVRRRRRVRTNQCLSCGYDLRASPGRCPECGVAAPDDATRASS